MTARFDRAWAKASRANLAASVGFLLTLSASQSSAARGRWRLRRQRPSLSEVCRAVVEP